MRYDNRFGYFGACYVTNDNGGNDGGAGGGNAAANNANKDDGKEPPWKKEFGDEFDPDKAWTLIQNQRREERRLKTEAETLGNKVKEFEDANKTQLEKAEAEVTTLKSRIEELETGERMRVISGQVADTAKRLGAVYPDDVYALVSGKLEIKDGKASNIEDVVKELATSRPMLFQASNIDQRKPSTNGEGTGNEGMNSLLRAGRKG